MQYLLCQSRQYLVGQSRQYPAGGFERLQPQSQNNIIL